MRRPARPSALEDHLGFWLRVLSNHVHRSFERALARHDVTVAQWVALRRLYDVEALSVSELASAVGVDQGSMSRTIERLIRRALVVRQADLVDGRAKRLQLTAEGRRLVPVLARLADDNDRAAFAAIPPRDRQALRRIIDTLVANDGVPIDAND
jgi:DNA-binding MarR family transcriptional regulator